MPATVVEAVKAAVNPLCITNSCCDSGCCVLLQGIPEPFVLVSLEHAAAPRHPNHSRHRNHPHCDFLLIAGEDDNGGPWVAPIELTTGNKSVELIVKQLRAGAEIVDRLLPSGVSFEFRPILAHDGRLNPIVFTELREMSNSVSLRSETELVELIRCRDLLADALVE